MAYQDGDKSKQTYETKHDCDDQRRFGHGLGLGNVAKIFAMEVEHEALVLPHGNNQAQDTGADQEQTNIVGQLWCFGRLKPLHRIQMREELHDSETKADQGQGRANPCLQRAFRAHARANPCEMSLNI